MLFRWLVERGMWTEDLRARFQKHANETWALAHEVWFLSNIPCPLLVGARCSAYDGRPFVCRTTWSIGDPIDCHPHRFGPRTGIIPRAEVIEDFQKMEAQKLRAHGLVTLQLSLSKAVLLADAILSGTLTLESVASSLVKDFRASG